MPRAMPAGVLISLDNPSANWTRRFWVLLGAVLVFRVLFTLFFCAHADLSGDEAYYWDWGRRPDWGYYSKPPMIGWIMGIIGSLAGACDIAVRLTALALGTLTLAALFALTRMLYDARTGFIAAVLVLLTPANTGLNLFLTIDAPLLLCWSLALLLFWFAASKPQCWWRWLTLAVVIGLGTLSKQMMLVFPVLMVAFAALSPEDRSLLKNIRMWVSILLGAAFLIPVILWQQKHHWITLEHTAHHFDAESLGVVKWLTRTLEWPFVQALLYSPVTWVAMILVVWFGMRHWKAVARRERYLLLCTAPALVIFTLLALRQRINPNWPAVFWVPPLLLAAAWFAGHLDLPGLPKMQAWRTWSLRVSGGMILVAHIGVAIVFGAELKVHKKLDEELKKWRETGVAAGEYLDKVPRPENTFVMALGHRYNAAQLAFSMPQHPRLYRWESSGHPMSQYEIWPGPEERIGDDGLIFSPKALPPAVSECFESVEKVGQVQVRLGDKSRMFDVFLGKKLRHWSAIPSPQPSRS
ncbi:MAG: glycosyltransferase family 39 protein [Verrucomicrobiota bacterium]